MHFWQLTTYTVLVFRYRTDNASYNKLFYYSECNAKTYGLECQRVCGNCRNGDPCHHVNGSCVNGCDKGTFGVKCDTGLLVYLHENGYHEINIQLKNRKK